MTEVGKEIECAQRQLSAVLFFSRLNNVCLIKCTFL